MEGVTETVQIEGGILVGHDGSRGAQEALSWAAWLAARADMDLHVVRAWSMMTAPQPKSWAPGYVPPLEEYEQAVLDELSSHVAAAKLDPAVRVTSHAVHTSAAQAMIKAAEGADLLVVGARGRGGFAGLLLGSTSDQVVRYAPCPVTVIRTGRGTRKASPQG